jgi:succinate dehydrogenase/fumarate reductase cytochrome b subunit
MPELRHVHEEKNELWPMSKMALGTTYVTGCHMCAGIWTVSPRIWTVTKAGSRRRWNS